MTKPRDPSTETNRTLKSRTRDSQPVSGFVACLGLIRIASVMVLFGCVLCYPYSLCLFRYLLIQFFPGVCDHILFAVIVS